MSQWVKDLAVVSLLWHRFRLWSKNFSMPWAQPKKYVYVYIYIIKKISQNQRLKFPKAARIPAQ